MGKPTEKDIFILNDLFCAKLKLSMWYFKGILTQGNKIMKVNFFTPYFNEIYCFLFMTHCFIVIIIILFYYPILMTNKCILKRNQTLSNFFNYYEIFHVKRILKI